MRREIHWNWNREDLAVAIDITDDGGTLSTPAGHSTVFRILERTHNGVRLSIDGKNHEAYFARDGRGFTVWCNGSTYRLESREGRSTAHAPMSGDAGEIQAPMAGKVTRVEVAVGDVVSEQQVVVILESMKMETSLSAIRGGRVTQVLVKPGDVVEMGAPLVIIE